MCAASVLNVQQQHDTKGQMVKWCRERKDKRNNSLRGFNTTKDVANPIGNVGMCFGTGPALVALGEKKKVMSD